MGKIAKGILGGFRGSVGPAVGKKWKTKNVLTSQPRKTTKEPNQVQLDQRSKISLLSGFFSSITQLVQISFKPVKQTITAQNKAIKFNMDRGVTGEPGNLRLSYAKLVVSTGSLFRATGVKLSLETDGRLNIKWNDDSEQWSDLEIDKRESDKLMIVLQVRYRDGIVQIQDRTDDASRGDLFFTAKVASAKEKISYIHCWLFFVSADRKMVSQSQFYELNAETV